MRYLSATYLLLLASAGVASAAEGPPCIQSASDFGPCLEIRGRISYFNGNPSVRIWPIGSNRLLSVINDELPSDLQARMRTFDTELWGPITVCPRAEPVPGRMQAVCVASWGKLVERRRANK